MTFWDGVRSFASKAAEALSYLNAAASIGVLIAYNEESDSSHGLNYALALDMTLCLLNAGLYLGQRFTSRCTGSGACDRDSLIPNGLSNLGPAISSTAIAIANLDWRTGSLSASTLVGLSFFVVEKSDCKRNNASSSREFDTYQNMEALAGDQTPSV